MNDSTTQKPETVKMSDYMQNKPIDQTPVTNATTLTSDNSSPVLTTSSGMGSDSIKPKRKFNIKLLLGAVVLLLIIIGAAAGLYLTQFGQDLRQQAYVGQSCTYSAGCSNTGEVCTKPGGGECNGASGCTCQVPVNNFPLCNSQSVNAFQSCDAYPNTSVNECTGVQKTVACTSNYTKWICGNKNWVPNYGASGNGEGCSGCAWPLTNGQCCPAGVDACNPNTDNYKCIADPFVAECKSWANTSCPANQQGYWKAIAWCNTPGCECGPNGLFSSYSGPGCDCGGGGIQCNDQCSTTAQCQAVNSAWSCLPGGDGFNRCRLTSNPSSTSCQPGTTTYQCNSDCSTTAQCQGSLGSAYSCVTNKCRLTANPTSPTCTPATVYQCNSDCTTTAQCQGSLGATYSCVTNKCRLTANPTSPTCTPATVYQCNSDCTTTAQCQGSLGSAYSCVTNKCRLTANPTSATCTPTTTYQCNSDCTTTAQCAAVNPAWSCVSNKCRLTANPTSATCTPATVYQCNSDCTTSVQCQGSLGANYSCVTNKCRLTANPTSPTCTPATVYQCNSDCTTTAQCQGSLGTTYSCVTNKCRLTANPTSPTCTPAVGPMCKDVAILDKDDNELDPKAVPSSFFISQVIKLRCAPDNLENPLIQKYQFRITEPTGKVIEGTALNPTGTARVSLPYTIKESGSFKAQCRICLTDGTCQTYTDIMKL